MSLLPSSSACCDPCSNASTTSISIADLIDAAIEARLSLIIVTDYGADPTGASDTSESFEDAVAAAVSGSIIYVPAGTYLLDSVLVDKDVSWLLHTDAVLLHKANPSGPMFLHVIACTGFIRGGTFDGNKANQSPYPQPRYALLSIYSNGAIIDGVTFQNYMLSAIQDGLTLTHLIVRDCEFLNGAEHGGTYDAANPQYSTCINIFRSSVSTANTTPLYDISGCYMHQDANNVAPGAAPGGIIAAGSNSLSCYIRLRITNNTFERLGQSHPTTGNAHHIGSVDCYSAIKDVVIHGNHFINNRYQPVKLTNCSRTIVTDNIIIGCEASSTAGLGLIDWQAALRGETGQGHETLLIRGNIIQDGGSGVTGIRVSCETGETSKKIIVADNYISGCGKAMAFINTSHPLLIKDNLCYAAGGGGSAGALEFQNFTGIARIEGNYFEAISGVHALYVVSGNTGEFYLDDNHFKTSAAGIYAAVISGSGAFHPAKVHATRNRFEGTTAGTLIAASGIIEELWFDINNSVVGTHAITFANVTNCVGSVFGTGCPENVVNASRLVIFRRTDGDPVDYKKQQGADGSNAGWRIVPTGNSGFITSGDYAVKLSDEFLFVNNTAGAWTLTLPAVAESHGLSIKVVKIDASVNTTTVQPVTGGNIVLSAQHAAKEIVSTGSAWQRLDY